ncbi:MAG: arginine deiminase family protein [Acidobacteriota bacterium]|nr:arginine deiminase family protein [Acidobacteriota bacterium]
MTDGPTHALVRRVSPSYAGYYARQGRAVSAPLADTQHQAYVEALESTGLAVSVVEPDETRYDCVFIEDTAVIWNGHALITRMYQDREGEQSGVEEVLQQSHSVTRIPEGATLEGGDVLHVDDTTYVGLSARTNQAGAEALRVFLTQFGRRVVTVPVRHCLHLKTGVTYLGNGTLLTVPGWFEMDYFQADEVIYTEHGEHGSANCLRIRDHLLVSSGYPATRERLQGFAAEHRVLVKSLDITEFEKGDGSLTCLSLIW